VEIEAGSEVIQPEGPLRGMLVDFSRLKQDLREETEILDHSLIIEAGSLREKTMEALQEENFRVLEVPFRPTAENFAKYFYGKMKEKGYTVLKATVYETPNNCAAYFE
jgi:6-pyruvoyltetrahydropterin/6-carboxytetrahydropterin synthase